MFSKPHDTIEHLLAARARGDWASAIACYEPGATVVVEPGRLETGKAAITSFTEATMKLPVVFGDRDIIEIDGIALHSAKWTLQPPAGSAVSGTTSDVLRRQPDGNWLIVIDNPWGTAALNKTAAP